MSANILLHQYLTRVLGVERLFFGPLELSLSDASAAPELGSDLGLDEGTEQFQRAGLVAPTIGAQAQVVQVGPELRVAPFGIFYISQLGSAETELLHKMLASIDRTENCLSIDLALAVDMTAGSKLNLILGEAAYRRVTEDRGPTFEQACGVIQTFRERRWLTTSGPEELLNNPSAKRIAWGHLKTFIQEMKLSN